MSNIEVKYESWKNGDPPPRDGWSFSNNTNDKGLIVDPISFEPYSSRMSTILIGNTIYSSKTLRQLFESNEAYTGLPGTCDIDEFVVSYRELKDPMTNNFFTDENLKEIYSKIFANTKKMQMEFTNNSKRRSSLARGKRKPTKKRRHTKRRIPRKRRRPTKRRR